MKMKGKDQNNYELKKRAKEAYKGNKELSSPKDVMVNKNKQFIIKTKSKRETREMLLKSDALKDLATINLPRRRRQRNLLLSVDL